MNTITTKDGTETYFKARELTAITFSAPSWSEKAADRATKAATRVAIDAASAIVGFEP